MMREMRAMAPWLMLVLTIAFVGWMVFDVGMNVQGRGSTRTTEVASVNGHKIDQQTFATAVQNAQELARQQGQPAPKTMEDQRDLEQSVLDQLIGQYLLQDAYKRRGIKISDAELRQTMLNAPLPELQDVPAFQTDSQFDIAKYRRYLQSGADPQFALAVEARYREELPRYKLFERLVEDIWIPDAKLWRIYRDQHDSVTAKVLLLVPSMVSRAETTTVSDAEIEQYYRSHQDDFKVPEEAYLSFVAVSRRPDSADSAAALDHARSIRQEIESGTSFTDVAQREAPDSASRANGGDLGEMTRGRVSKAFGDAVFSLRPNQISQPVLTQQGYHIIQLLSRHDSTFHAREILVPITPVGQHQEQIDRRADSLDMHAAQSDNPALLDTIAERLDVPLAQAPKLVKGNRLQLGRFVIPDVHLWAFETEPGHTSSVIETDWAYYVFRLDSTIAAHVPPLSEIKEQVQRQAVRGKQWQATRALASSIAAAVDSGADLDRAAQEVGMRPPADIGPFTRRDPSPILRDNPEAIGAAFGLALHSVGGPYESPNAIVFLEPLRRTHADSAAFAKQKDDMRTQLTQQAQQARIQLVMQSLRNQANITDRREELDAERVRQQETTQPLGQ